MELTRRRYSERPDCWHVYFGDVKVGTIAIRSSVPFDVDQWEWKCRFYPGSEPGEHLSGTAASFEQCRQLAQQAVRPLDKGSMIMTKHLLLEDLYRNIGGVPGARAEI
jgi:hypothetical protein